MGEVRDSNPAAGGIHALHEFVGTDAQVVVAGEGPLDPRGRCFTGPHKG
ncbi:hypothetical protein BTZ20_1670 [Rhodococcus sp. MTM3W5.2]|nr:hypothetical protein BTZ20_1670 [Rhodococcus sp. MTM3W5.2]